MRLFCTLLFSFAFCTVFGQLYATTEGGRQVKLNANGTWEYVPTKTVTGGDLKKLEKPAASTTLLRSKKNDFALWYDDSKWQKKTSTQNEVAEYQLTLKGEDAYCMMITEKIEIDIENLKEIALKNAQEADPNAQIDMEEDRMVNGIKIKYLQLSGTIQGIKFIYQGYYSSDKSGTIQLICYTGKSLLKQYQPFFLDLLNGLTALKSQ